MDPTILLLIAGAAVFALMVGALAFARASFRKVERGTALTIVSLEGEKVTFTGAIVSPFGRAEVVDLTTKPVEAVVRGKVGASCKDCIRADVEATFYVRVNSTVEDVLRAANTLGSAATRDREAVASFFRDRFVAAIRSVAARHDFDELAHDGDGFRDDVMAHVGMDLGAGYCLDDLAIGYLEMTPIEMLDPEDVSDARGIRKIIEQTTAHNIATNEAKNEERKRLAAADLAADEVIYQTDLAREALVSKMKVRGLSEP